MTYLRVKSNIATALYKKRINVVVVLTTSLNQRGGFRMISRGFNYYIFNKKENAAVFMQLSLVYPRKGGSGKPTGTDLFGNFLVKQFPHPWARFLCQSSLLFKTLSLHYERALSEQN